MRWENIPLIIKAHIIPSSNFNDEHIFMCAKGPQPPSSTGSMDQTRPPTIVIDDDDDDKMPERGPIGSNSDVNKSNSSLYTSNSSPKLCDICHKDASFLCSGCQKVWYCGQRCQVSHLSFNSFNCLLNISEDRGCFQPSTYEVIYLILSVGYYNSFLGPVKL